MFLPALLMGKVVSKSFGRYPSFGVFRQDQNERWYYRLIMSTGLTFGTISSVYGLVHGLVTHEQYSFLVAAVIASAVVPPHCGTGVSSDPPLAESRSARQGRTTNQWPERRGLVTT